MINDYADILLVDDTPDNLRLLATMLGDRGYKTRKVTSGALALKVIESAPPDLVLLDVMMSDLDGYEVCQQIKADPDTASIPVIFISALDDLLDKVKAFTVGGVDYITKPFQPQEIIVRVESQLKLLRLQNQLRAQNRRLQSEIEAHRKAQEALEATLKMRNDLSNMLVHDLRNPVSTIEIISNSALRHNRFETKTQEALESIRDTAQQLNRTINELLIVAKMDAGQMLITRTEFSGNLLVHKVVNALQAIAAEKQCTLTVRLPEQDRTIEIDANLIRRALDNLISNAIKYSPSGSEITVGLEYFNAIKRHSSRQAKIYVRDRGFGIPANQREKIFERFKIGNAVNGMTQVGLGLAFCKMVVEAHGGRISVEENQPQGSIFTIVI